MNRAVDLLENDEVSISRKVDLWRLLKLKELRLMEPGPERDALARKFYEADRKGMRSRWRGIEKYLVPLSDSEAKQERDRLIKPRPRGSQRKYDDVELPTLDDYRKLYGPPAKSEAAEKPPRFDGPVGRVETRDELFKETFPELVCMCGELMRFELWELIETKNLLPKFLSYGERKAFENDEK